MRDQLPVDAVRPDALLAEVPDPTPAAAGLARTGDDVTLEGKAS